MSAHKINIEFVKTYATEANAEKAALAKFGDHAANLRFMIVPTKDGRFGVLFIGQEALQNFVHIHFNVIA
jgi:hypothetical protein